MGKEKLKSLVTSFTADGEYLAILSPDGTVRVSFVTLYLNQPAEFFPLVEHSVYFCY